MATVEKVGEAEYLRIARQDGSRWELHRGRLREKPGMSIEHNVIDFELGFAFRSQLDRNLYGIRVDAPRVRRSPEHYYIPDVAVVPTDLERALLVRPGSLDAYDQPLPLVVEVWSPSTGDYDQDEKLAESQRRGDLEIWRIHPYQRTLIA